MIGLDKEDKRRKNYYPREHFYRVTDQHDPHGNEWVNAPDMNYWRKNSYETHNFDNKWNPYYRDNSKFANSIFLNNMKSHSNFYN